MVTDTEYFTLSKISLNLLEKKATKLISKYKKYKVKFIGYSLKDL